MKGTRGLLAQEIAGEELSSEPEQASVSITGLESSALISQRNAFAEILSCRWPHAYAPHGRRAEMAFSGAEEGFSSVTISWYHCVEQQLQGIA